MQCRSYSVQLARAYETLQAQDTEVLVIGGGKPKDAASLVRTYKLPFPVLADPDRAVYLSYGLDKAMFVIQRSASIIVNKQGVVGYFHKTTNPMEWLDKDSVTQLIEAL